MIQTDTCIVCHSTIYREVEVFWDPMTPWTHEHFDAWSTNKHTAQPDESVDRQ